MAVGRLAGRLGNDRRRGLRIAASAELALSTVAVAVAAFSGQDIGAGSRYALIALLALAMGVQNATARRLAVADLTDDLRTLRHRPRRLAPLEALLDQLLRMLTGPKPMLVISPP
jgi:Protein of unknown function (DUF1275)